MVFVSSRNPFSKRFVQHHDALAGALVKVKPDAAILFARPTGARSQAVAAQGFTGGFGLLGGADGPWDRPAPRPAGRPASYLPGLRS
jgi:hypothetical protein